MDEEDRGGQQSGASGLFVRPADIDNMRDPLASEWNRSLAVCGIGCATCDIGANAPDESEVAASVDFGFMNEVFADFLDVVGLPIAIIDLRGQVLASSKWQRLCMDFHRVNPETLARCLESDVSLSREMREGSRYAIYRCRNGLTDCATPIVVDGVHVANLFIGQFLLAMPDREYFKKQQERFGFDETEYFKALAEVPVVAEGKVPAILKLMGGLAQQIARQSLAEKRALASYAAIEKEVAARTRELSESHERWRKIAAQLPGLVYQFQRHPDGRFSMPYASDAIRDLFGVEPGDVREDASRIFDAVHPDDRAGLLASILDSAKSVTPWRHEFRVQDGRGRVRWLYGDSVPQVESDGVILWHGFTTDVTERKRNDEELRRKSEELARSNDDLERFAYVASHDLQTPLRTIASFTQLLARRYQGRLDADADEFIGYIVQSAHHMSRMITDLLDYARVTSRGQPLTRLPAGQAVKEALSNLKGIVDETGASITVGAMPEIMADHTQLVSLFQNLVGNALKYRHPDRCPEVTITAAPETVSRWRFDVRDNGIGIEPEFSEKIFEIFQRLAPASDREGTGIGLAICQRIVHRFGGRIWVESVPGRGSTFRFTLNGAA